MSISLCNSKVTSYSFFSEPPVPEKYILSASTFMVGLLQSSTHIVRKIAFFLCAQVTGGGIALKMKKIIKIF